jgi:NADPH:quinone reductase-like Zn-dependent oxidoreductase
MKAMVYTEYGPPEVLRLEELAKPVPNDNEVLIRMRATTVAAEDYAFRKGGSFAARLYTGLRSPKRAILGTSLAGDIAAVGKDVKRFKVGDPVFGTTAPDFGTYAEYICLPEDGVLAIKPANLSYEEAAAACDGTLTALPSLRDAGNLQSGQRILINGASGAVGTYAVQLAKYFGANVTGVCSTGGVALVKSLGADQVIDYTQEDFTKNGQTYDLIFDAVGKSSFSRCKNALAPGGIYLTIVVSLGIFPQMLWTALAGSKKAKIIFTGLRPANEKVKDLALIKELVETGRLKPTIDRRYSLEQIAEAHGYVEQGHKKGNVVITVGNGNKS